MRALIGDIVCNAARSFGDREALSFPGTRTLTFAELDELAGRFAGGLARLGLRRGDAIVLHLPNSWQWVVAYHAIARLGGTVVPANSMLTATEVAFMADDSGARAIILPAIKLDAIARPELLAITDEAAGHGTVLFAAVLEAEWLKPVDLEPEALFTIGYTSGTTGRPKGAMLSHGNIFASISHTATLHVRTAADRVYSALPFTHVYGNIVLNAALLSGGYLYAPGRFDASAALQDISKHRITLFEGVPTMYYQMLSSQELPAADLRSLTRCTVGGQTMPLVNIEAVMNRFGCPLLELWGMTELAGPATSHSPFWVPRPGSVGLPFPGVEIKLADAANSTRTAAPGALGEVWIRGPLVTKGYWNNPEATNASIDSDGWLATGDIGRVDEDGYLYIVDRKKDMMVTAGYNIYPAELEQVIAFHPSVAMVAVTSAPCDEKGEIPVAFVVLHANAELKSDALIEHCRTHLAAYKVPRRIEFVPDLPKTSTGKIMRRELRPSLPVSTPSV